MERKPRASSRKKISQIKKEIPDPDEQTDLVDDNDQRWTASENLKFIDLVLDQFQNASYKSYRDSMGQIKWNMVKIGQRTENACRSHLEHMVRPVKKFRTLNEILTEIKKHIPAVSSVGDVKESADEDSGSNAPREIPKPPVKSKKKTTAATATATSSQQSADVKCLTNQVLGASDVKENDDDDSESIVRRNTPKSRSTKSTKSTKKTTTAAATAISSQRSADVKCFTVERRIKIEPLYEPEMIDNGGRKRKNKTNGKSISAKKRPGVSFVRGFDVQECGDDSDST